MTDKFRELMRKGRERDEKIRQWTREKDEEVKHRAQLRALGLLESRTIVKDGSGNVIRDEYEYTLSPTEKARRDAERERLIAEAKAQVLAELHITGRVVQLAKPGKDDPLDRWFDYYHACKVAHIRYTLKELAQDVSLSYGWVRQQHELYMNSHET